MSWDTATRFNADFATNIAGVYTDYEYVYAEDNDGIDLDEYGSGPVVEVNTEVFEDRLFSDGSGYIEEGEFIINFWTEKGSGTDEAGLFYQYIRDQYRESRILQGGGEGGIYIENISRRPRVEVGNRRSETEWIRHIFFLPYTKHYVV
jgi:hypothetical protein